MLEVEYIFFFGCEEFDKPFMVAVLEVPSFPKGEAHHGQLNFTAALDLID